MRYLTTLEKLYEFFKINFEINSRDGLGYFPTHNQEKIQIVIFPVITNFKN